VRLLVDSHVLIWSVQDRSQLSPRVARLLADGRNRQFVSMASIWELAMKASIGKLRFARPFDVTMQDAIDIHRYEMLEVKLGHALRLSQLPAIHRDPFDRMLVAQAIEERCTLVTKDRAIQAYPVEHLW
jgi:PIN domain nuclease of toxin-antitoxin system